MAELFEETEDDKALLAEEAVEDTEAEDAEGYDFSGRETEFSDARRRLENMLEERRLKAELDDYIDF